jgi:hypothetical protein
VQPRKYAVNSNAVDEQEGDDMIDRAQDGSCLSFESWSQAGQEIVDELFSSVFFRVQFCVVVAH